MPLQLIRNDITQVQADAIVLPANTHLEQGRGTSRAIFLAAGEEQLEQACRQIGYCPVGSAVMTPAFNLDAKKIIHAVCPVWEGGDHREAELLYNAYTASLKLAYDAGLESIAFPLLSAGNHQYPKGKALNVANHAIMDFLTDHDLDVLMVFYDYESVAAGRSIFQEIDEYIDDHYVEEKDESYPVAESSIYWRRQNDYKKSNVRSDFGEAQAQSDSVSSSVEYSYAFELPEDDTSLTDRIKQVQQGKEENFHKMLFRLIDESGMSAPAIYTRANMSRKLYSKIKTNEDHIPKKKTIVALAVALRLDQETTEELLKKAGYALSDSSMFDVIISFFLEKKIYDVFEINEALFEYGLENELLGF